MLKNRPSAAITVDAVVVRFVDGKLQLALITRKKQPFMGQWALPGGFLEGEERAEEAVLRELKEETGLEGLYLEQFYCFTAPKRDPRGRVISISYLALTNQGEELSAQADAAAAAWWDWDDLPALAFDHADIVAKARDVLKDGFRTGATAYKLLPSHFTLTQLQQIYETALSCELDKRNFRKKVQSLGFVRKTTKKTSGTKSRPAQLFRFDEAAFKRQSHEAFYLAF